MTNATQQQNGTTTTPTADPPKKSKQDKEPVGPHAAEGILEVPFHLIDADEKFNVRSQYHNIEELAALIKSQGQLNPLIVRETVKGRYSVVAGFRRYKAFSLLAEKNKDLAVLVRIRTYEREDLAHFDTIAENVREDVTNYELATMLKMLEDKFGTSRKHLAKIAGKSEGEVSQLISCLSDLTPAVRKAWEASIQPGATTDTVAKALGVEPTGDETKMDKFVGRKSGEIPLSRLVKWKKLESTADQKAYADAYLKGHDRPQQEPAAEAEGEDSGEGLESDEGSADGYPPPTKKEIRAACVKFEEKKKESALTEAEEGKYKALRWVLGQVKYV